jgi:hypothetical protein
MPHTYQSKKFMKHCCKCNLYFLETFTHNCECGAIVPIDYDHDCKSKIFWDLEKSQYCRQHKIIWNVEENYHCCKHKLSLDSSTMYHCCICGDIFDNDKKYFHF